MNALTNTLQTLFGSGNSRRTHALRRKNHQSSQSLESLEQRSLLTAVAAPEGLVSWWKAENSGADVMGLNNASLYNGATYATGEAGKAFSFDGVNDRAQLADVDSLKFTTSMTIETWIRVDSYTGGVVFFRGDDRGGLDPYNLSFDSSGNLQFAVTDSLNNSAVIKSAVPLGQLIHVAGTLDDATGDMRLYVNGAVVAHQTTTIRPFRDLDPASNPSIGIGNHGGYPITPHNFPFHGLIDELAVYNRALTPGEVFGIAKAGSSGKVLSPIAVDGPSVVEGATGTTTPITFTIQRTGSLAGPLTVAWVTADDTATAGSDYVATSGSVTFADGEATKTVDVTINGDNNVESNEAFRLIVTPTGGASVMGIGTIVADDVSVSVASASATEGGTTYRFTDNFVAPDAYGLAASRNLLVGPTDGNIYVANLDTDVVKVFDPKTGLLLRDLSTPGGELDGPWGMVFGPDGGLYVGGKLSQNIVRFDVGTGTSTVIVATASGGLGNPRGLAFGPDGSLYATSHVSPNAATTDTVKRYDGTTGAYLGDFVTAGSGGLNDANGLAFGPDGNLYVASNLSNEVKRYNGQTGAFINNFVTAGSGGLVGPRQLLFQGDGNLYVASAADGGGTPVVSRYNATTGAFVDIFASSVPGTNTSAGGMAFATNGEFYVAANTPTGVSGSYVARFAPASMAAVTVTLGMPVAWMTTVDYATAAGSALAGSDYTARSGTMIFAPGETSKTALVSTVDDTIQENDESFVVNLSSASVNAVITTSQGTVTIHDDDAPSTKFYVVNDGSPDRTYEYGATGNSVENYTINSGNTAPRGAASSAAGSTVWVADANRKVYVYNTSGGLLGSWTAGTLQSTAQVEGITTNGTDVWIVDNKTDKVFKYTAAAELLSGSQNSTSSFALNSSNTNPKGIVTDGTSIWVINDSTTDKIFKYSLSGSLQGSWTIDAANSSPTGLTIDPANVSNIWTVDSGTDKVYQYSAAASRTSGSQTAAATFALAPGNTNPQDIADPPVPGSQLTAETSTASSEGSASSAKALNAISSVPLSPSTKLAIEFSALPTSLRDLMTASHVSVQTNVADSDLRHSVPSGKKRPGVALNSTDQIAFSTSRKEVQLDDLFADWSFDPLQLLSAEN